MPSTPTLVERGEAAQKELKKLRFRFLLGAWITGIVGLAILALLTIYFRYGYTEISSLKDPKFIVSLVGNLIDDQIPQARQTLESQVDANAAVWAQQASDQVVAYIPSVREQLEDLASQQVDKAIDQINFMGEKEFRRVLDENRETVTKALKDLEDDHEISEGVLVLLEEELAKELKMDKDALAGTSLVIAGDLNKSAKRLLEGKNLSEEQEHERRVMMIVRRLQNVQFGDAKLQVPTISSPEIVGSLEQLEHARLDREKEAAKAAVEKPAESAKEEPAKPAEAAADKPAAEKAPEAKEENAAKPEAAKADPPAKAEADSPAEEKKVAEAKPADK
jgi:hypothetical protein